MTPAQKAANTRKKNEERRARSEARSKISAPVRKEWKDVRVMIRALGSRLRPSSLPERWRWQTPEQREADIIKCLGSVREYVLRWEQAKIDVAQTKRSKPKARS